MARAPRFPVSDHCDGTHFFNPGVDVDKSFAELRRWRRTSARVPWPVAVVDPPEPPPPLSTGADEIALTFVGQATVLIQVRGCNILTDPIFSPRASPVPFAGPRRVRPPGIGFDDLPPIDLVLLSHNHYDHMDLPTLRKLHRRFAPRILTGLGNAAHLARCALPGAKDLDWWDEVETGPDLCVAFVPAQHWSSRTLLDRRRTLWGGFVIRSGAATVYFAGDTGYTDAFAGIARRFRPDIALLPIGAYEPRWFMRLQHMNPAEAVQAHRDLGATLSLGLHWGTFQLTDEAIDAPLVALADAKAAQRVDASAFVAPGFGHTLVWRRGAGA